MTELSLADLLEAYRLRQLLDAEAYRQLYYEELGNRVRIEHEHAGIVATFAAGDAELVIRLLDEHRGHATTTLGALLKT